MSIISDAAKNKPGQILKIALFYALVICFGLFTANELFKYITRTQSVTTDIKKTTAHNVLPPVILNAQPKEITQQNREPENRNNKETKDEENSVSFVLNGIFFSGNTSFSLINNQIVKA